MAVRARLTPPRETKTDWPWHQVKSASLRASLLFDGARRMEAENFLASGYGARVAIEAKAEGWARLSDIANVWQPPRLKGTIVSVEYGRPYLSATQVFDVRPTSRRYLAVSKIVDPAALNVVTGQVLVTRSGNVGRSTVAYEVHSGHIISDDLLRVDAKDPSWRGWVYAYLRAPTVRAMMKAAQYGHIIKHLETQHLNAIPIIDIDAALRATFEVDVRTVITKRDRAYALTLEAEEQFTEAFGKFDVIDVGETGFRDLASRIFMTPRRRLDAWHHNPSVQAIVSHLSKKAVGWSTVNELGFNIWLPTRFRRVPADDGLDFLDSSDFFENNPDITKRIADGNFGDAHNGRVNQGWILLSRSGQIYGLNGSAMIAGHCHENKIVSDHIIRIAPQKPKCRVGYLLVALTHPNFGRPRVKALPYGSSIPEIEVADAAQFAVPRTNKAVENRIADCTEKAARLRDEADELETQLGNQAETMIGEFLSRKST